MTTNGLVTQQVSLAPGPDHSPPQEVCEGSDGNLYGTMPVNAAPFGAIFRITRGGGFSMIYSFDNTNGNFPYAPLIQARDGKFYGVTEGGGAFGYGVIYRLSIPSAAAPLMRAPILSSDGLQLSWTSLPGRSYQLQFKSTLDQSAWSDSGGSITSTGTVATAIDQTAPGSTGFYRVVLLP
jgi:uncharacterized repeat protein (TIGR03803 family)